VLVTAMRFPNSIQITHVPVNEMIDFVFWIIMDVFSNPKHLNFRDVLSVTFFCTRFVYTMISLVTVVIWAESGLSKLDSVCEWMSYIDDSFC